MRVYQHLKKMRQQLRLTLEQLSRKVGYGTGNLSSYETGKLQAKDATLLRILMRGYDYDAETARQILASWRQEELEAKYHLNLAQTTAVYNSGIGKKSLEEYLQEEGLNSAAIRKVMREVAKHRPRKK